jgi:diaminohydroxyphosphoribosylaminopyrimidine deaminase/5-amino-6-(5-phosphoribosylamino)uracil reductase
VIATTDPDPRVAGRGIALLKAAGIAVETGLSASQADFDHAGFFKRIQENRPYVTLKLATTLDGRIATKTGDSQWITGPQARRAVHAMRARYDAVMVGAGTARADDPQLNVRGMGDVRQPVRVVISKSLELPSKSKLLATSETLPVWLVHGPDADGAALGQTGVQLVAGKLDNGEVDLADAMTQLAEKGLTRIFCEGGGRLASSLLRNNLVDELIMFTAGVAIGADGLPSLGEMGLEKLSDAPRFSLLSSQRVGSDIMPRWSIKP